MLSSSFLRDHYCRCRNRGRRLIYFIYIGTISVFIYCGKRDYSLQNYLGAKPLSPTLAMQPILLRANSALSAPVENNISLNDKYRHGGTLAREVESINHLPKEGKIVVQFKRPKYDSSDSRGVARMCKNPVLVGRLSGPFISYNSRWEKVFLSDCGCTGENRCKRCSENKKHMTVDKMVWRYHVPQPGRYFVEVLGILCNDVDFSTNITNMCLEDSKNLRITHEFALVDVIQASLLKKGGGYWRWSLSKKLDIGDLASASTDYVDSLTEPLLTRYQPVGCRDSENDFCLNAVSTDRFSPYEFYFVETGNESNYTLHSLISSHDKAVQMKNKVFSLNGISKPIKLCFVGASHSREMAKTLGQLLKSWGATNIIQSSLVFVRYPELINHEFIKNEILNSGCSKSVVAVGQWPLGASNPPVSFPDFSTKYFNLMNSLSHMNTPGVFMRSIHLNSLGDVKLTCPPTDWRNPPVIGIYNDIIRNLTRNQVTSFPFIDTDFIIGPMWDSAPDFCHFPSSTKVAVAEALYILEIILFKNGDF